MKKNSTYSKANNYFISNENNETTGSIIYFQSDSIWHLAILIFLPFFIYIKTTGFELIDMDDVAIIRNHEDFLSSFKNIGLAFKTDAFINAHGDFYRPLQTISFIADGVIGGMKVWIFHLSNLIYHLITVLLFYFLLLLLDFRKIISLYIALLFAVHPLLTSTVSWIPSRGDELLTLFGLAAFIGFIRYTKKPKIWQFVMHSIFFTLSIFSKEVAIFLPIIFLAYFYFARKNQINLKVLTPFFIIWCIVIGLFFYLRSNVVIETPPDSILGINPFFKNLQTIPILLGKTILPIQLSTMPLFQQTALSIGMIVSVFVIYFVVKKFFKQNWLPLFGLIWFIVFVCPPLFFKLHFSNFLVEYYEHRSYMPIIGLLIILACFSDTIFFKGTNKKRYYFPVLIILIFTGLSSLHADNFKNSNAFFSRAADMNNPGALTKRGEMYLNERDATNAAADFDNAITLSNGEYPLAFFGRGVLELTVTKKYNEAENDFSNTIILDTNFYQAYLKRSETRNFLKNNFGARADAMKALAMSPNNFLSHYTLGKVNVNAFNFEEALKNYDQSILLNSNYAETYNDRGYVKYRMARFKDAILDYTKGIAINPGLVTGYYNKGMSHFELKQYKEAINEFDQTLSLVNNFYMAYFYRGLAKQKLDDSKGACKDWQESVNLGFTMAQDTMKKYCNAAK